jgi:hypothetical protein
MKDLKELIQESINEAKLESGYWYGDDAYILDEDGDNLVILVGGGYSEDEALYIQKLVKADKDLKAAADYVKWIDRDEWDEQQ